MVEALSDERMQLEKQRYVYEQHIAGNKRQNLIKKAYILSSHPSPFSVSKPCKGTPAFKGSKPFSTANDLLLSMGGEPIDWSL